jgi:hypothetical protein
MVKITVNNNDLYIEGATNENLLSGTFRNFAGEERKDRNTGRIVNSKGSRNFNFRIPPEYLDLFKELGCNIKMFGGNPEEGEEPIYFIKVNVNTETSKRPPKIQLLKSNDRIEELPVSAYNKVDGMFIENVDMLISLYKKYETPSLYLNVAVIKQHLDPISEKYSNMLEINDLDPNAGDEM